MLQYFWHFFVLYSFLILFTTFVEISSVNASGGINPESPKGEGSVVDHEKLKNVKDRAENGEAENYNKNLIKNLEPLIKEMVAKIVEIGNEEEFEGIILPFIKTITDIDNIQACFNKVIEIKMFDKSILQFFKNASTFERFVEYFNKRYEVIKNSKKTSKTLKNNLEVCL
ncbi:unnamed protein product [Meloidogyne enterolobii]|uniref:Uncharacterized protein n=1 Tax=Meloidogyne enterolobii TaxID=390850 RepID=A0ACB1B3M9_MELEN